MSSVSRRRATEEDDRFLFALFMAVRAPEFAGAQVPAAQLDLLMQIQYAGQKQSYAAQYPDSGHELVLVDGNPAGRIWICRMASEHRLVDIALLPEYRNQGIGSGLLRQAITSAGQAGVPLRCSVGITNAGSLRFHQRLGFRIVSQDEVYAELELEPGPSPARTFDQVSRRMLSDPSVRDRLLRAPDLPALFNLVLAFAEQHGFELREQDLQTIVNANRLSWLERWLD